MSESPLEISCQEVHDRQQAGEAFHFLDCREPAEYATAKIAGTTLLPMSEIAERVAELEPLKHETVIVHCHHGGRSMRVVRWLRGQGFDHAINMAGGIDEWSQAIDPSIPRY